VLDVTFDDEASCANQRAPWEIGPGKSRVRHLAASASPGRRARSRDRVIRAVRRPGDEWRTRAASGSRSHGVARSRAAPSSIREPGRDAQLIARRAASSARPRAGAHSRHSSPSRRRRARRRVRAAPGGATRTASAAAGARVGSGAPGIHVYPNGTTRSCDFQVFKRT